MRSTLFREFSRSGGGFIVNRLMIRVLGVELAIFISDLADRDAYHNTPDGWFYATKEHRMAELGMTEGTVIRLMKEALAKGIVNIQMRGVPAKQYIKIDYEHIQDLLEAGLPSASLGQTPEASLRQPTEAFKKNESLEETKPNTLSVEKPLEVHPARSSRTFPVLPPDPPPAPTKPTIEERNEALLPIAERLAEIIKLKRRVTTTASQLKAWADEIRKLCEGSKINPGRVRRALDWYAENIGGEYVPVIESGSSLRYKFTNLEAAVERDQKYRPALSQTEEVMPEGYEEGYVGEPIADKLARRQRNKERFGRP